MAATGSWPPVASSSSAAAVAAAESSSLPSPPHEPDPPRLAQRPQPAPTANDDDRAEDDVDEPGWRNRGGIRLVGSYRGGDEEEEREVALATPVKASRQEEKVSHHPAPTPSILISSAPPPQTGSIPPARQASASQPSPAPAETRSITGYDNRQHESRRPSFSSSSSSVATAASSTGLDPRTAPAAASTGTASTAAADAADDTVPHAGHGTATSASMASRAKRNRFRSSKPKSQRKGSPAASSSSDFLVPGGTAATTAPVPPIGPLPQSPSQGDGSSKTRRSTATATLEDGGGVARLSSSRRSSSAATTSSSSSSSKSLKQSTARSYNGSAMVGFAAAPASGSDSSLSLSPSASGSRSGPSTTTTPAAAGGEGRLARGLRKTRSGLKLFAARAAAASSSSPTNKEQEPVAGTRNPTSSAAPAAEEILPFRDFTWQAVSPPPPFEVPSRSDAATATQLDSSSSSARSRASLHSSTLGDGGNSALSASQPASRTVVAATLANAAIQPPPSGNRIAGWFNSLMPTTTTSGTDPNPASPVKARTSSATTTASPKRRGSGGSASGPRPLSIGASSSSAAAAASSSPLKKTSSSSAVTSTSTASGSGTAATAGRFGPFDRMLDRAVQYFLDTDSHADRCEDEIWLLGVQHAGWNPDAVEEAERLSPASEVGGGNEGGGTRSEAGRRGGLAGLVARRASPVKSRKMQQPAPRTTAAAATASGVDPFVNASSAPGVNASSAPGVNASSAPAGDSTTSAAREDAAVDTVTTASPAMAAAPAATRIHGWPAAFYRDFYSRIGLTYRSDFPLIKCDPPRSAPANGTSGVVHGMLSNLGMSLGRGAQRLAGANENSGEEKSQAAVVRGLSSDTGWGCMLRTGQSLLANALVKIHLGRDWRRPLSTISPDAIPQAATYARILSLFLDDPSPLSPFSVHRFARQGKQLGKEIGEWFGPSTAAGAIKTLVNAYEPAGLRVVSCIDGTVYESEVVEASTVEGTSWKRPVLVLVNVRLGLEGVNAVYYESIKSVFRFPQSVGIAGGRPISSYYFVGAQADSLFYIDPHFPRPAIPLVLPSDPELVEAFSHVRVRASGSLSPPPPSVEQDASREFPGGASNNTAAQIDQFLLSAYPDSVWATYHCDKVRKVSLSSLDPSMLIGFVVENESDWFDFRRKVQELSQTSTPMFTVAPFPPAWLRRTASTTTAVRTTSGGARNSLDDSFSVIGESRAGDVDNDDGFSEPEDWELQSTDDEGLRSSVLVERSTPPAQAALSRSPDDGVLL